MAAIAAPRLEIVGEVKGGRIDISNHGQAGRFSPARLCGLDIVLRAQLSPLDYGEQPGGDTTRQRGKIAVLKERIDYFYHMARVAEWEAIQSASEALYYILGGDRTHRQIEERRSTEQRLAVVTQLIAGFKLLTLSLEHGDALEQPNSLLTDIDIAMNTFAGAGAIDGDLVREYRNLQGLDKQLTNKRRKAGTTPVALAEMRGRLDRWVHERDSLRAALENEQTELDVILRQKGLEPDVKTGANIAKLFTATLAKMRRDRANEGMADRADAAYVTLMERQFTDRLKRSSEYRKNAREKEEHLEVLAKHLHLEHQLVTDRAVHHPARLSGVFDEGVILYMDPELLEAKDTTQRT